MAQLVSMAAAWPVSSNAAINNVRSLPNGSRNELEVAAYRVGEAMQNTLPVRMVRHGFNGACSVVEGFIRGIYGICSKIDRALTPQFAVAQEIKSDKEKSVIPQLNKIGLPMNKQNFEDLVRSKITFESGYTKKQKKQLKRKIINTILKIIDYSYNKVEAASAEIYFTQNPNAGIIVTSRPIKESLEYGGFGLKTSKLIIYSDPSSMSVLEQVLRHEFTHAADATITSWAFNKEFIEKEYAKGNRVLPYREDKLVSDMLPFLTYEQGNAFIVASNECIENLRELANCVYYKKGCSEKINEYRKAIKSNLSGNYLYMHFSTDYHTGALVRNMVDNFAGAEVGTEANIGVPIEVVYAGKNEVTVKMPADNEVAISMLVNSNLDNIDLYLQKGKGARAQSETNAHLSGYLPGPVADEICPRLQEYRKGERISGFVARLKEQEKMKKKASSHQDL